MKLFLAIFFMVISIGAKEITFDHIFKKHKLDGTILISSLDGSKEYVYNKARLTQRFSPASTFKIACTLIALQEKVVKDENTLIKLDGVDKEFPVWNQDHSIKTAFPASCVWYYQELAKKIGLDNFKKYIKAMKYGNELVGDDLTHFWIDGELKISAQEQIDFLKKVYLNDLSFDKKNIQILKKVMLSNKTDKYEIYSKTAWARKSKIAWFIGYIKTKKDVLFFAMNIDMSKIKEARLRRLISIEALKKVIPESF